MTVFLLVPGIHTGGWIWREVAARLRESGAEAHPVTLTGMGELRDAAGPGTDLETHIQDLVRLIDRVEAPDVVMVGHGYGIQPVLGAAGLRPERISRIVHLDTGIPQDGDPALALVPDQTVRDRLAQPPGTARDDGLLPPPEPEAWQRLGSVTGIPEDALAQLARLAAPQPVATLTQPLRLTKAAGALPTTGILCTANGAGIETVEALVAMGEPRLQVLTDPRVTLFELDTGHWPMLSSPGELAEVLLRAVAGEGHRVAASVSEQPAHLRPFLMDAAAGADVDPGGVPERPRERVGRIDLHLPDSGRPSPAVVFVHGGPVPAGARPTPRDWPAFVGYGQYVASRGAVGVVLDHRLHGLTGYGDAAEDLAEAVERVRADPRVDGERVALWFFSGGGLLSADWLAAPPPWLRCVAATYPVLAPLPNWGLSDSRFRPAVAVRHAGRLPIVLTRVELERAEIATTIEEFLTAAEDCGADVEVVDVPLGHHGFETIDHTEQARDAVDRAVRSVLAHLRS